MRNQIKSVATELLIAHGVRGLRFGDIAARLGITRANVHYYFGTKNNLVDVLIDDYVKETTNEIRAILTNAEFTYEYKARRMMEFNYRRYCKYNRGPQEGRPWSLISRLRLEVDQISEKSRQTLLSFTREIETDMHQAVEDAQKKGELTPDAPVKDIAIQLISIVDSAGSITQDGGSFDRLERLYMAHINITIHAYGSAPMKAGGKLAATGTK